MECLNKNCGLIVGKGKLDELYNALQIIKANSKKEYSSSCRDRAIKYYDKNNSFMEYINLYKRVL